MSELYSEKITFHSDWLKYCTLRKKDGTRSNDPSWCGYSHPESWDNYTLKRDGKMIVPNGALSGHLVYMTGNKEYGVIDIDLNDSKQVLGILSAEGNVYSVRAGRVIVEVGVYETHCMVRGGPMEYRTGDILYPSRRGLLTKGVGMDFKIDSIGVVLDVPKKEYGSLVVDLYL